MDTPMFLGVCGLLAALSVLAYNTLRFKVDPREPPVIYPKIPLIGHILGSLTEGATYNGKLYKAHGLPIFTLPMLNGRTYIVASPPLCAAVQRASSTLSLDPIINELTPRMIALNQQSAQALQDPEGGDKSGVSMYKQSHGIINPPLAPQNNADILKTQLDYLGRCVNDIENGCELDLFAFFRRGIAAAGNWTFYGPNNPFAKHPELLDRFWDWEDGIVGLLLGLFPSITARKAQKGLEACARGFEEYIKADRYKEAHTLMQQRNELHLQHGVTGTYERAKFEVSIGLGINVNASIATFWLVNSVYSRPELLSRIRDEIRENALVSHGVLSAELLRQACPLLNSVYRETLRFYAPMSSVRLVQEDTIIADTYLLRKDAIVQLAGGALHQDKALWGPDAELFNPERFIHSINGSKTNPDGSTPAGKDHILHPATFRSFGGGASLCPGRHFAQMEILNLSAAMLLGFDLAPINGTAWDPLPDRKRLPLTVMKPLKEVKVKVQPRKEFEGVKWMLEL